MQFGRSYEEFEVGATYKHWPGKTVTEYDDHLFCLLTMNHHPLHLDSNYAERDHAVRQERRGRQLRLLAAARHERPRRLRQGHRQPRGRVAQARRADLPRRHDLRPDRGPGQVGVEVQGRPRRGVRRDQGLQPGRHAGVRLPAQGDGAQAVLPRRPRWRAARAPGAGRARAEGPERPRERGRATRSCGWSGTARPSGAATAGTPRRPTSTSPTTAREVARVAAGPAGRRRRSTWC